MRGAFWVPFQYIVHVHTSLLGAPLQDPLPANLILRKKAACHLGSLSHSTILRIRMVCIKAVETMLSIHLAAWSKWSVHRAVQGLTQKSTIMFVVCSSDRARQRLGYVRSDLKSRLVVGCDASSGIE